jgi:hypothetical protein
MTRSLLNTVGWVGVTKKIIFFLIVAIPFVLLYPVPAIAQQDDAREDKYLDVHVEEVPWGPAYTEYEEEENKWDVGVSLSAVQGYDNNASLDAARKGDTFSQGTLDVDAAYKLSDVWGFRGSYTVTDITYYEYTDASLLDNAVVTGLEMNLYDTVTLYTGYELDVVYYPENELTNYVGNSGEASIRHNINDEVYQKLSYLYLHKGYTERRARDAFGNLLHHREDNRHTAAYEIGGYHADRVMLKMRSTYYHNDSNDKFFDYYDYDSYKTALTFIYLLSERIYVYLNGGYEYREYENRIVPAKSKDEEDDIWTANCAVFYDITDAISLGLNYSFREVNSNDDTQEYASYLTSAGIYCTF